MRVVVVGGTGNIGTSLLRLLDEDERISSVVSIARRPAALPFEKVEWRTADVADAALGPLFRGADAVVHLAFLLQPMRDEEAMTPGARRRTWRTSSNAATGSSGTPPRARRSGA